VVEKRPWGAVGLAAGASVYRPQIVGEIGNVVHNPSFSRGKLIHSRAIGKRAVIKFGNRISGKMWNEVENSNLF
jgi:hypothetical protein